MTNRELDGLLSTARLDPRTHSATLYVDDVPMQWLQERINKWGKANICTMHAEHEGRRIRIDIAGVPKHSPLRSTQAPRVIQPWHALEVGKSVTYPESRFPNIGNLRSRIYQFNKASGRKIRVMHSHGAICLKREI